MKNKKIAHRRIWAIILAGCLLIFLAACDSSVDTPNVSTRPNTSSSPNESNSPDTPSIAESIAPGNEKDDGFPVTYTIQSPWHSLKSGKLVCTFHGIRLSDDISELSNPEGFRSDAAIFCVDNLSYPEFIQEDGQFVPGVYLLLVNITVTSDGAVSNTRRDRDSMGNPLGQFDDPYLFRSDDLVFVVDLAPELTSRGFIGTYAMAYFSDMNRRAEHPVVFRLEPGESIDVTVGFLVSDIQQGGDTYFDSLYLADGLTSSAGDTLIHLDLSGEEVLNS